MYVPSQYQNSEVGQDAWRLAFVFVFAEQTFGVSEAGHKWTFIQNDKIISVSI